MSKAGVSEGGSWPQRDGPQRRRHSNGLLAALGRKEKLLPPPIPPFFPPQIFIEHLLHARVTLVVNKNKSLALRNSDSDQRRQVRIKETNVC